MSNLLDWFGNEIPEPIKPDSTSPNPCVNLYGPGPDEAQCKDCTQIAGICKAKTYYKCRLRENTHGKATDHKLRWSACAKFVKREGNIPLYDGRG